MADTMQFTWTEDISVGDETIDEQHRGIIAATNQLLDVVTGERRLEDTYSVIVAIERYIRDHFSYEETYMAQNGYPEFEQHRRIHEGFINNFLQRKKELLDSGLSETVILNLENYLGTWILRHVGEEDKKYARYILGKSGKHAVS